jgi:homoserine kinase
MVRVRVPATSANLGPGFDTLGVALGIYNEIEMAETGILADVIEVDGHGDQLEQPEHNLVWQAAQKLFAVVGYKPYGFLIREKIGVPVARGLGSSAAAIVGGLVAANALYHKMTGKPPLTREQLLRLAVDMEGHPDNVTPALVGGFVVSIMEEGRPLYVRFDPPPGLKAVVAIPEVPLVKSGKTEASRGLLPSHLSRADAVYNVGRATLLVAALLTGQLDLLEVATKDRLHQPYRESLVPGLRQVFHAALGAGARGVALSGAGPSVIALADHRAEFVADAMVGAFQWAGSECRAHVLDLASVGAEVLEA